MTITRVQEVSASTSGATSINLAFPGSNTAGNLLIASVGSNVEITGVTDSQGNSWQRDAHAVRSGAMNAIWSAPNCAGGSNTVTATAGSSVFVGLALAEYSGAATASHLDQANVDEGFSGSYSSGSITTTEDGELLVGGLTLNNNTTITDDPGFTLVVDSAGIRRARLVEQLNVPVDTYSYSGSLGGAVGWVASIASYKATGGGSNNELAGSTSLTFAASGALTGKGALSGDSSLAFSPSATIQAKGRMSGSSSLAFSASGAVKGKGGLAGTSSLTFGPSGTLTGRGSMAGTSSLTFGATGALLQSGALAGSSSLTFAASGTLRGKGLMSGTSSLTFSVSQSRRAPGTIRFTGGRLRRSSATGSRLVRSTVSGGGLSRPSATGGALT